MNKRTEPRLRFRNFKGEWKEIKLGKVAKIVSGGTPSTKNMSYWNGDIDWYSPEEIEKNKYVNHSQKQITELGLRKSSATILPKGSMLFTSRAGIGKTAILSKDGCTNQGFQSIVPYENKLDTEFIYSMTYLLKRYADKMGCGSTFIEISRREMNKMPVIIPSFVEQQRIGNFFSNIDYLIMLHSKKLELSKKLKRGYLQKMFPQDSDTNPRLRFSGFSDDWKKVRLKDISRCEISKYTEGQFKKNYQHGNYKVFEVSGEVGSVDSFDQQNEYISIVKDGSGVGTVTLRPGKTSVINTMNYIKDNNSNIRYLFYLLKTFNFRRYINGTGVPHIYYNDYSKADILVPSIEEQEKIGNFFYNFDKRISLENETIKILKKQRKAYLQKMFI